MVKLFLRLSLAAGFLSAVADRFGFWPDEYSAWGNWADFVEYTGVLLPWFPVSMVSFFALLATMAEVVFGLCLIVGFRTSWFGRLSGVLLLFFGISMAVSLGLNASLDYFVFVASAAAFALGQMEVGWCELDMLIE